MPGGKPKSKMKCQKESEAIIDAVDSCNAQISLDFPEKLSRDQMQDQMLV